MAECVTACNTGHMQEPYKLSTIPRWSGQETVEGCQDSKCNLTNEGIMTRCLKLIGSLVHVLFAAFSLQVSLLTAHCGPPSENSSVLLTATPQSSPQPQITISYVPGT